jgi:SAM-dependent methyltransferase
VQTVDRDVLPIGPGLRVLDLGCGEGRHVIATHALDGADSVGVDLSLADLGTARSRHAEFLEAFAAGHDTPQNGEAPLMALLAADALVLPFRDGAFDVVICSEVLEHLPDYRGALREIERVLRPGGRLCISVPRPWCERICWRLSRDYHQVPGGHLRIFRIARLRGDIEALGLQRYYEHGAHALHTMYWWLQCLLWERRERSFLVRQYHRLLVWDMMKAPALTRSLERILNPILGKSVVMYFLKPPSDAQPDMPAVQAPPAPGSATS